MRVARAPTLLPTTRRASPGPLPLLALLAVVVMAGCSAALVGSGTARTGDSANATGTSPSGACLHCLPASRELTVYAAASLTDALERLAPAFEASHPNLRLVVSTDASSALRAKIEQGAPADVFLSADVATAQALTREGLADTPVAFARSLLTVVVPAANPANVRTPADLARPGLKVVAAGPAVPITRYAEEALARLAALPGYPSGFVAAVEANIVSREDNVRAVLTKVELGEADAGIVYATDARSTSKVLAVAIPAEANVPATYAAVAVSAGPNGSDARVFIGWLAGPEARAALAGLGFLAPP